MGERLDRVWRMFISGPGKAASVVREDTELVARPVTMPLSLSTEIFTTDTEVSRVTNFLSCVTEFSSHPVPSPALL